MTKLRSQPAFDPICGARLDTNDVTVTYAYVGQTYEFCCRECCNLFARAPEDHVTRLAHEPWSSAGHRCSCRCWANEDPVIETG